MRIQPFLVIQSNDNNEAIEISHRQIISHNFAFNSRQDLKNMSYGIVSNVGSIVFKDTHDKMFETLLSTNFSYWKNSQADMYLRNQLLKKTWNIGTVYISDWNVDTFNGTINARISDGLEVWQNIIVPEEDLVDYSNPNFTISALDLLNKFNSLSPSNLKIRITDKISQYLQTIHYKFPRIQNGSLWSHIDKLANACLLHIYKDSSGYVECSYLEGA